MEAINLINVFDNPEVEDRYVIRFTVEDEIWEIYCSEDGEVFFSMDVTTANDIDNGEQISFDSLPQLVKEKVHEEWRNWHSQ